MLQIEVIGNLGSDAEIKEINGKKYVSFSVADSYRGADSQGNRVERTNWVSVLWYGDGGRLFPYLKKGTQVFVRGRMSIREWNDRTGEKQFSINANASEVTLCGGRVESQEPAASPAGGAGYGSQYPQTHQAVQEFRQNNGLAALASGEDDLPF